MRTQHTCTHTSRPHSWGIGGEPARSHPLWWGDEEGLVPERAWGHEGPQLGLCPLPVPGDPPLPPLTLSVLCPQAPAAGEGPSGTGIVCGAAAPSSPLNQLSLFFSFMLLFSSCHVAGFSFQLSPLQAHVRINAGGVLCRAGGSPACLCRTPPSLPPAPSLGEIPPHVPHTRRPQQSWLAGVEEPSSREPTV